MQSVSFDNGGNLFERRNKHNANKLQPELKRVSSVGVRNPLSVTPNQYLTDKILHFLQLSSVDKNVMNDTLNNVEEVLSTTELDSHANMPVVGLEAYIISETGKTAVVQPYSPDYDTKEIPIVHAAIQYDCPYTGESYILVVRNALYVQSMKHNLIPPFLIREAGVQVREIPKIHIVDPSTDDHAIYFKEGDFRIPLKLRGTFSMFHTSKPSVDTMLNNDKVYILTPSECNTHSTHYAENEERMLNWQGEMQETKRREPIYIGDITSFVTLPLPLEQTASEISSVEIKLRGKLLDEITQRTRISHAFQEIPFDCDEVGSAMARVNPLLNDITLVQRLEERANLSSFIMNVGSSDAMVSSYIFDDHEHELDVNEDINIQLDNVDAAEDENQLEERLIDELYDAVQVGSVDINFIMAAHASRAQGVSAEHLAKVWKISIDEARRTLDVTRQSSVHKPDPKLARNFGTNDRMLRYKHLEEYFFMDTLFATTKAGKSSRGNSCCQLFVTDKGFLDAIPLKARSEVILALKEFAKRIGVPEAIICDASGEQSSQELRKFCQEIGTTLRYIEEGTPWANKAELYIGLVKRAVRQDMKASNSPVAFWDYCIERKVRIMNVTAKKRFNLKNTNAYTQLTSEEADISNLCQYDWYEWCYYMEHTNKFPFNQEVLGRVLGPAKGSGNEMAQWILKSNGNVVPRRTLRPLKAEELYSPVEMKKRDVFDALIERRWGTAIKAPNEKSDIDSEWNEYNDEFEKPMVVPDIEDSVDGKGHLLNQQPQYDKLIHSEVSLQVENTIQHGKVIQRTVDPEGQVIGTYDDRPHLNTMSYDVEFSDGSVKEYSANLIAENMIAQCDEEGMSMIMIESIIDYKKDSAVAVSKDDAFVVTRRGMKRRRKSTQGWKLLVKWKDHTESWIPLKDLKESNPVEVAEFARARNIADEPAFAWWVPYTLRKRDVILSAIKTRVRKTTHKYGVEVPTSIAHAEEIDAKNGNHLWREAIALEMKNVGMAFEVLPDGKHAPPGWRKVTGHLIFDVKLDLRRKARWVLDGHKTPDVLGESTFAGVVSRDSVRILMTYAALNELDLCAADILNAYLQAPSACKDYILCGPEFGLENVGRVALIHRALYGGKTSGRDFRNHLRTCMRHLGFESCPADPDVWMRPGLKKDGSPCYEYVLLYVDDALACGSDAELIIRNVGRYFELKESSVGPPKMYLGGSIRKVELENGASAWGMNSSKYCGAAVANVRRYLENHNKYVFPKSCNTPLSTSYRPELDATPGLDPAMSSYYMSLIGILRWLVELGRVDICLEVSVMSSHMAMPREGQLMQLFHVFAYLDKYHNAELVLDPSDPVIDERDYERKDWSSSEFSHLTGTEELPPNQPEPRGLGFTIKAEVDADHAGDTITRRSRTGFFVYCNSALIYWFSKKQNSVESSSFGSEFIAMKQCCEYIRGLRYKLRMFGIPVNGPAYISGDNQSVLANTSIPDSTLKKKNQSIAYHFIREGCARDEWRTAYVNTNENKADLLTKQLAHGAKRKYFIMNLLHHIFRKELSSVD